MQCNKLWLSAVLGLSACAGDALSSEDAESDVQMLAAHDQPLQREPDFEPTERRPAKRRPIPAVPFCDDLNSFPLGIALIPGSGSAWFATPYFSYEARPFQFPWGGTSSNAAIAGVSGASGTPGVELSINNVLLNMTANLPAGATLSHVEIPFGFFGGTVNLSLNDDFVYAPSLAKLSGSVVGGVSVSVVFNPGSSVHGVLVLDGVIAAQTASALGHVALGGQELFIGSVCEGPQVRGGT